MEYMLLRDGTVKVFETLPMHEDVINALADYDGVAYYWTYPTEGWRCITPDSLNISNHHMTKTDVVPEVIKLAQMLE